MSWSREGFGWLLAAVTLLLFVSPLSADRVLAAWLPEGNPASLKPGHQLDHSLLADGNGGVIVAWGQHRPNEFFDTVTSQVNLAWLTSAGSVQPGWPEDGFTVEPGSLKQYLPRMASDSGEGLFIVWSDGYGPQRPQGIRVQRLRSWAAIAPGWPSDGVTLATGEILVRSVDAGPPGTVFAAWTSHPSYYDGETDTGALRVDSTPLPVTPWGLPGVPMDTTSREDSNPRVVADPSGGACILWVVRDTLELLTRKLDPFGAFSSDWPPGELSLAETTSTLDYRVAKDAEGFFVTWSDEIRGSFSPVPIAGSIYLHRVLFASGPSPRFPAKGTRICAAASVQIDPELCVVERDAIVVWSDYRDSSQTDVYAQRVTPNGTVAPGWPADGVLVAGGPGDQTEAAVVGASDGGVWITWRDRRDDRGDVYLMKLDATGAAAPGWLAGGRRLGAGPGEQSEPALVTDGSGGAFVSWIHRPLHAHLSIRITRVSAAGAIGPEIESAAPAAIRFVQARPNPARDSQLLVFELPSPASVTIDIYDVAGRLHRTLEPNGGFEAGTRGVAWDGRDQGGRRLARGIYLARIRSAEEGATGKLVLLD